MSFSDNCSNIDKMPGPLRGNPMNGLCEKASIEVKKVFDACIKQETLQDVTLVMSQIDECEPVAPYKFVSAKSFGVAEVSNLVVTPTIEDPCLAHVTCDVLIPLNIVFTDAKGNKCLGKTIYVASKNLVMRISQPSLIPYSIEATASVFCPEGEFVNNEEISASLCVTIIMKVVMPVDLLVPSYGYSYIPPCQEYTEEVCSGVFDLPLFPDECGISDCRKDNHN